MSKVKVGAVGLGMGRHIVKELDEVPEAEVVAVCDSNPALLKQRAEELGVSRTFTDYDEMLEKAELDAMVVALPNHLHASMSIKALERGLHVFCEKPLARTAEEVREVVEAAKKADRIVMVDFTMRFWPHARFLKAAIDEGRVGDVYFARTWWTRNRGIPKPGTWYGQRELSGGGPLVDIGVHRLDLTLWLMGFPKPVTVSGVTYGRIAEQIGKKAGIRVDVEDLASGLVRFSNGASLNITTTWAGNTEKREDMGTEIYGTEGGCIHRNVGESYEFEAKVFGEVCGAYTETVMRSPANRNTPRAERFVRSIAFGEPPEATAEESLVIAKIIDGLYKSARAGKEVGVQEDG